MSASRCMHHALAIAATPEATWAGQIQRIPDVCPCPEQCGKPLSCRERNADYLRVQWRMKSAKGQKRAIA